jgi:hypothetical protein
MLLTFLEKGANLTLMLLAERNSESAVVGTIGGVVGDNDRDYIYEVVDTDGGILGFLAGRESVRGNVHKQMLSQECPQSVRYFTV